MPEKLIADFIAHFENRKHNLAFDVHDGTAYIYLIADGMEMAGVVKLLLLKGKQKVFRVKITECQEGLQEDGGQGQKRKGRVGGRSADA